MEHPLPFELPPYRKTQWCGFFFALEIFDETTARPPRRQIVSHNIPELKQGTEASSILRSSSWKLKEKIMTQMPDEIVVPKSSLRQCLGDSIQVELSTGTTVRSKPSTHLRSQWLPLSKG